MEKLNILESGQRQFLPHFLSDLSFKGTVVNRALLSFHGGSLEITLTVPLNIIFKWLDKEISK